MIFPPALAFPGKILAEREWKMTVVTEPGPPPAHDPAQERKQWEDRAGLLLPVLLAGTTASIRPRGF